MRSAAAFAAMLSCAVLAQTQEPRPTFKSTVDVVPVDVSVVDKTGRPISDLTAKEFSLTVDGRPRRVASAQFISFARHTEEAAPVPLEYSSNAAASGGRLIAIVVDQGNIGSGTGKLAIDAARRFIDGLNRADRVALYTIPGAGPRVDFSSSHALVRKMTESVVGTAVQNVGPHNIGVAEALGLARNDPRIVLNLIDRECPGFRSEAEIGACRAQLAGEARSLEAEIRARTRESLLGLRDLFERLAMIPSPKTLVLITEGLFIDRELSELTWVAPLAAQAQLSMYALQLEPPLFDSSNTRVSATRIQDIDLAQQGLGHLVGLAKGDVFRVTAGADFAFSRISRELSGYYLLSFEPDPLDRDGKTHRIQIGVPARRDVIVRARSEFKIAGPRTRTTEDMLGESLRSPLLANDVRVKVATYNFWDAEAQKVRVVIATDIDRSADAGADVALAYALIDAKGALALSEFEPSVKGEVINGSQGYVAAALVSPGVHTLKLAVVDSTGKRGSIEHTFNAAVPSLGQIRVGGILLARRQSETGPVRPAVDGDFSTDLLHAYLELASDAPQQLENAEVILEVAQREEGPALDSAPIRFQDSKDGGRTLAGEAAVTIGLLPPGDYVARAVLSVSGRRAGQIVRPFRIVK